MGVFEEYTSWSQEEGHGTLASVTTTGGGALDVSVSDDGAGRGKGR